ncbi:hypothetical protein HAX54_031749 [Datura stramonium]|uniref:Uncharacterized protein n=1 Tax=Datura stramonium TaxID=4076 RepID=A0ABS8SCA2_DATST|nr:hypothetical protein [Datura stramonium]
MTPENNIEKASKHIKLFVSSSAAAALISQDTEAATNMLLGDKGESIFHHSHGAIRRQAHVEESCLCRRQMLTRLGDSVDGKSRR